MQGKFRGFRLTRPISNNQRQSTIVTIFENIITIIWENKNAVGNRLIYKREYDIDGTALSKEFQITKDNNKLNYINPSAISFKKGVELLKCFVWHQYDSQYDKSDGIYFQCLDEANNLKKSTIKINHHYTADLFSINNYNSPYIISDDKGGCLVFFSEITESNNYLDIYMQIFDENLNKVYYSEDILNEASFPTFRTESAYESMIIFLTGIALTGIAAAGYSACNYLCGARAGYNQIADLELV